MVTGARAPIAADLARCLATYGHEVHVTDSMHFPVARFSPFVMAYHRLPAPGLRFEAFRKALVECIEEHKIERILPTSEEIFWLAQIPEIAERLFAPSMAQLDRLHDKAKFAQLCSRLGYGAPHAIVLSDRQKARAFLASYDPADFVLKPCYSRFGSQILISPSAKEVLDLDFGIAWLAQSRISGKEVCIYSIAWNGMPCLTVAYEPVYRAGPGASLYFKPFQDERITAFVDAILSDQSLSGQISFDVMLTETGPVALECNPRGVSGLHLAAQVPRYLVDALLFQCKAPDIQYQPGMLASAFMLYQARKLLTRAGRHDFRSAQDVLSAAGIPFFGTALSMAEIVMAALKNRESPQRASTRDIEWNGSE